jgi:hypothetical protein
LSFREFLAALGPVPLPAWLVCTVVVTVLVLYAARQIVGIADRIVALVLRWRAGKSMLVAGQPEAMKLFDRVYPLGRALSRNRHTTAGRPP